MKCVVCHTIFDNHGDAWKKRCWDCYKNFKNIDRIRKLGYYHNDVYIAHKTATKDEIDGFIKANKHELGWGATLWLPENYDKFNIWVNYTNYD